MTFQVLTLIDRRIKEEAAGPEGMILEQEIQASWTLALLSLLPSAMS